MDSMQYYSLKQITKSNVSKLEQVWSYKAPGPRGRFAFSPLVVDRVMYVAGSGGATVGLGATTWEQIWSPPLDGPATDHGLHYRDSEGPCGRERPFAVHSDTAVRQWPPRA